MEDSLKSAIADAGGEVAAGSPLRLVCRSKPGDPKSVKIKTTDRGTNTVICDTTICEIALYDGEDQLWRQEATFGGPTITTGSMQEFQQSIEDTSGPNVEFFTSAELPTRLLRENAWNELPTHKIER